MKLTADGTKEWDKTIREGSIATLHQTVDGGYMLGGSTNDDYYISKLNANGSKAWEKTFGGNATEQLTSFQITGDNGYVLGGASNSPKSRDKSEGATGFWIIAVDALGNKQWDKTIAGNYYDYSDLQLARDGSYILGGIRMREATASDYHFVKFKLNQQTQTITFAPIPDKSYDTEPFTLRAQASSGLPVAFSLVSGPATLKDSILTITGEGTVTVKASQAGNAAFLAAPDVMRSFKVIDNRKPQTIAFPTIPNKTIYDQSFTLTATASSGLPVSFHVVSGAATIKGNMLTLIQNNRSGTVTIEASQLGNETYKVAPVVTQTFTVEIPITKQWDRTLGSNRSDQLQAMVRTADGGYLLGGSSESDRIWEKTQPSQGGADYWIVKLDSSGIKLWDKTYGGSGKDELKAVIATPDGGYLLGGTSASGKSGDKSQASKGQEDYWIVKVDSLGNKLWDKTIGSDAADTFTSLISTPDGGYLLGGYTLGGKSGDKTEASLDVKDKYTDLLHSNDYWVVKLNSQGEQEWDKTLGGKYRDELTSLVVTDGGYLLAGISDSYASNAMEYNFYVRIDMRVYKISTTGQVLWDKSFSGISSGIEPLQYDEANIIATTDGNYLLGGSGFNDDYNELSVLKITKAGANIWAYANNGYDYRGSAMINTPDGGYLMGGSDGENEKHYLITKLDTDGQVVYTKSYNSIPFSGNYDYLKSLLPTTDGGYLLGGYSQSNRTADKSENSRGDVDYWLIKIKEETTSPPVVDTNWNHRYGGSWHDKLTTTIRTFDGGYVTAGYSRSPKNGDKTQSRIGLEDYWLVKTDKQGQKLWDKRFGGPRHDFLNHVIQTSDGGYLLGGSSDSNMGGDKSQNSQGNRDYWIIKLDKNGNKLWDKRFGGNGYEDLRQILQLPTGGYLLAGYSNSPASGDKTQPGKGGMDYWIVKIDANGEKQWDRTYGGSSNDFLQDVALTSSLVPATGYQLDGGLLLGGSSNSGQNGDKSQASRGGHDFWIIRLDSTGQKVWDKRYGGTGQDEFVAFGKAGLQGDGIVLAGNSDSPKSGDKTQPSQGSSDYWLVAINAAGEIEKGLYDKPADYTYGGSGRDELRSLIYVYDQDYLEDGFVLGGTSYSVKSGDKNQESQGGADYWVVRVDPYGRKLADQRLGGSQAEELRTVVQTGENEFLLAGRSESGVSGDRTQPSQGQSDYWLIHTTINAKPLATEKAAAVVAARTATTNTPAPATLAQNLVAYPNPFQEKVTVSFSVPTTQPVSLQAYDSQGRKVATLFQGQVHAKQRYEVEWQPKNQASGLYFLRLQTQNKVQHQKVLLSK